MSPRRKIEPSAGDAADVVDTGDAPMPKGPRRWRLWVGAGAAALVIAGAITASTLMLISHESDRRASVNDAAALDYVRSFMTAYTSPDPFQANAYADKVLAQGTGEFATVFKERMNEIVLRVAQTQPTTGSVLEAGVERWNDDGSANVLVATKITTTTPDGKSVIEVGNRWVATAIKEGQQWKISQLIQVI